MRARHTARRARWVFVPDDATLPRPSVAGTTDPEGESPWAMQLVVHLHRGSPDQPPPTRTALCEAAAVAVVRLLTDPRSGDGGAWAGEVQRWTAGRIRKHCRRARGAAWQRVQELPGVTAEAAGAQVRAFVPSPVDAIPKDLAKLQLSGTEPEDPEPRREVEPQPSGPLVVSLTPEPFLPLGKAAAAAGHAAQLAAGQMSADRLAAWTAAGFPVLVEQPDPARWAWLRTVAPVQIVDAGFTVVRPGTCTAVARWA